MAKTLLLIEDNPGDVALISELLLSVRPNEYRIESAMTLAEGLNQLKNNYYDVVISDLSLPDSDGLQIIGRLQDVEDRAPIIVMTGNDNQQVAVQAVQQGAQDYLVKGQGDGHLIGRAIDYSIERKKVEKGLSYLAQYDALTGLANRVLFKERLARSLIRADRNNTYVALMFIDLDRFKNVNDTLGHDAGDRLLIEVSKRLSGVVREGDTIARLGGDEFTIILEEIKREEVVSQIATKLLSQMTDPFEIDGMEIFVTPSIGITMYPQDSTDAGSLLKNADTAMYRAKDTGRNGFQFYTADMNTRSIARLDLESKLRRSLEHDEFVLYYQPKIDLASQRMIGTEALIRWRHPELGILPPGEFIPLAEEIGMIESIGNWVIKTACKQIAEWQEQYNVTLPVAVNISARQFRNPGFVPYIDTVLQEFQLEPSCLEIEITESAIMEQTRQTSLAMKQLKERNIRVSIDDFGTGYSSLNYLRRFMIDTLKIDRSFVQEITEGTDEAAITCAIIALGKSLNMNVVAEGVETGEQAKFLFKNGCNEAQGYHFSKPIPAEEITHYMQHQQEQKIKAAG